MQFDLEAPHFWHDRSWWREPAYAGRGGFSPEYREAIICSLAGIFDKKWYRNSDIKHGVLVWLHGKGTWPYDCLMDLAESCHLANNHDLLNKALVENLRLHEHFLGAYFEVSVMARLIRGGITPRRPPRRGKNADFLIAGEPNVYLEVKHAKPARGNTDARAFELEIMQFLQPELPTGINYKMALGSKARELLATSEGARSLIANFPQWRDELKCELTTAVAQKIWHQERGIPGYCTFILSEATTGNSSGEFSGAFIMPHFEVEKLCESVIRKAASQISAGAAGIIIIRVEYLFSGMDQAIQDFLIAAELKNISLVILKEQAYAMRVTSKCVAIHNPEAQTDLRNERVVQLLTNWPN